MDPRDLVRQRPGTKQALRIQPNGLVEVATSDATVSGDEIQRLLRSFVAIGSKLGLGAIDAISASDGAQASLHTVESDGGTLVVVDPPEGDLDKRAGELHRLILPVENGVLVRRHGIVEIRR
jgi:hypothetical protein